MSDESGRGQDPVRGTVRALYKNATLKHLYPDRYRAACKDPVIPGQVVFLEVRENSLSDNFRVIKAALERRNTDIKCGETDSGQNKYKLITVCIREGIEGRVTVMKNCLAAIPVLARAQFIFINEVSYFFSSLPIRPQTTVIQTWHACGAFKKFGYSTVGKGFGTSKEDLDRYPVHRNFSYVTVSSPEVVWAYAEAFHMEDKVDRILPVGVSRTDMFFSGRYREKARGKTEWVVKRLAPQLFTDSPDLQERDAEEEPGVIPGKKIILYAPTFRGTVAHASAPDRLDIRQMRQELRRDCILLIKHHPFVKQKDRPAIPETCRDFAFDVTDKLSIEELLTVADVCITDYSSLIFEYSLFERLMVFFAYDMQEYLDERGFYYPIEDMMPGPVCSQTQEVIDVLKKSEKEFDLVRVRNFKYRFMSACDGHVTQRILRLMDQHTEEESHE